MLVNKIDGAPDAAQAVASATLLAKDVSIPQSAPWIDTVKENGDLANQNHAMAIIVQQVKSREERTAYWYRELEKSRDWLYLDIQRQRNVINDLKAWVANNNTKLISEFQDNITSLEEAVEVVFWTDLRQSEEIRCISSMEESINWERKHNCMLCKENCRLHGEVGRLRFQINDIQSYHPGMESKMEYPPSKETTSCAACSGETAGGDN
jgi:hypothetical protein